VSRYLWALSGSMVVVGSDALAQAGPGGGYGQHMWNGGWHGWFMGPLMMIVFIIVAVVAVLVLVRWLGSSGQSGHYPTAHGRTPLDILQERFAKGEIDREEYEEKRRLLRE